jgi:hypothetical protein
MVLRRIFEPKKGQLKEKWGNFEASECMVKKLIKTCHMHWKKGTELYT